MRAAIEKYSMLENGDRVAVGVSGGKDSLALLMAMNSLKNYLPVSFDIAAVSVDPCFFNSETDYSEIEKLCRDNGIEYMIKRTGLYRVVFDERREKNPCSLCAKMRRGILCKTAADAGFNKLALGHHLDDAAETFMMNLLDGGTAECFRPVSELTRSGITLIRPMIFARESEVASAAARLNLPVVESVCPMDKNSQREKIKNLLTELDRSWPASRQKIINALQKGEISGW